MTDEFAGDAVDDVVEPEVVEDDTTTQYGVGPFTVREVAIIIAWAIAFVVSFFPLGLGTRDGLAAMFFGDVSVWASGLGWVLTIGVPTVAVFLIVLRRFSPDGIRRVGSLGVDQFASVAASVASVVWLQMLWETISIVVNGGPWVRGWVVWVELALMLALVVLTVFAPFIAPLSDDFEHRPETVAHRNARPVRAVVARPRRERPVAAPAYAEYAEPAPFAAEPFAAEPYAPTESFTPAESYTPAQAYTPADTTGTASYGSEPLVEDAQPEWAPGYARGGAAAAAAVEPEPEPEPQPAVAHQAFWALAPVEREVVDDRGIPIFSVGPTAWALVIEDRGEVFVIRHEDGRIGYLHDVSGVTRG